MKSTSNQGGFTLIEVMIVVVIVAILAAVAVPSYRDSIQKTRRADAREALTRIAAMQERFFFTNNSYTNSGAALGLNAAGDSVEGYYTIAVSTTPGTKDGQCGVAPCFLLRASPKATGPQAKDTKCAFFTLSHTGKRGALDSDNKVRTAECW